jgi:hypothetical protein
MTTGALIFAFNNQDIDYVALAEWSAKNIRRHLDIPTTVVTNNQLAVDNANFDRVIFAEPEGTGTRHFDDVGKTVPWYNANRVNAYTLSPYDQTLLLDADYVVASDQLRTVLKAPQNFMCHRQAYNLATADSLDDLNKFGAYGMPMWWATVIMFRKSNTSQYIFDCMQMVRDNWQHYRDLYGITKSTYRNDFALSIALGIVSGHTLSVDEIPWGLASVMPNNKLTSNQTDGYDITFLDQHNKAKTIGVQGFDFHAMGKRHLGDIVASTC